MATDLPPEERARLQELLETVKSRGGDNPELQGRLQSAKQGLRAAVHQRQHADAIAQDLIASVPASKTPPGVPQDEIPRDDLGPLLPRCDYAAAVGVDRRKLDTAIRNGLIRIHQKSPRKCQLAISELASWGDISSPILRARLHDYAAKRAMKR